MSLDLVLSPAGDTSSLALGLKAMARRLEADTDGAVRLTESREPLGPFPDRPCLSLLQEGRAAFHYMAVPEGPEAAPFQELLSLLQKNGGTSNPESDLGVAELMVFIARSCPFCPQAVRAAHRVALAHPEVTVAVVDAGEYPGLARLFGVRSVPMTILDRGRSWSGVLGPPEIEERIRQRGGGDHDRELLLSLIRSGRFDDAVSRIVEEEGRAAFVDLWRDSTLETRLGLLIAAETALEAHPRLLDPLVPGLIAILETDDPGRRGDTVDLLGRIGHPQARRDLERMTFDSNPDVLEAAEEALEKIRNG